MGTIVYNNCGVITILPMNIDCSSVNSSTPITNDGRIYLNITGGSAPYSVTWSNGSKDQNLKNVPMGSYTGTVVDYYGDYTATTVCTVDSNTYYVDYFKKCNEEYYLYLSGTSTGYGEGLVYRFNTADGCWTYSGLTLSSGVTVTTDTISTGPYDTCLECDPPAPELPYYPTNLCLYSESGTFTAYPFTYSSLVNGRPSYTGSTSGTSAYTMSWITATTFSNWIVLGRTGTVLKNSSDTFNPLGGWVEEGTTNTWFATSGSCPSSPELSFTLTVLNESCEGLCNGSVVVNAKGGVGGYQYKLFNSSYQSIPLFNNLCPQNNTQIIVKDSGGTEVQGTFTILPGTKKTTYTLSLETKSYWTKQDYGNQTIKKVDYQINVSPALPDGITIDIPLYVSVKDVMLQPGSATTVYSPVLYSGTSTVSPTSNSLTSTQVTKANQYTYRYPYSTIQKTYSVQYPTVTLRKGLTVSGTVTSTITKISDGTPTCSCSSYFIENPDKINTLTYNWVNCTGGTENNYNLFGGQSVSICACSVSKPSGSQLIITSGAGSLNCGAAIVDANEKINVGFNGPSISDNCTLFKVLTPQTEQLINTLYQQ